MNELVLNLFPLQVEGLLVDWLGNFLKQEQPLIN